MAWLIDGLVKLARRRVGLQLGLGFQHRGITVRHDGVVLDQERLVKVLDTAITVLVDRYGLKKVEPFLSRIDVHFQPGLRRPRMSAGWSGGYDWMQRGEIVLHHTDDWPDDVARGFLKLLLMELDPQFDVEMLFGAEK